MNTIDPPQKRKRGRKTGPKLRPGTRVHVAILMTREQRTAMREICGERSLSRWLEDTVAASVRAHLITETT